jgi:protocatechuate 3,4-dioxygenase alpha subunit
VTRTPSQTIGPFFKGMLFEQPVVVDGGEVRIEGRVLDGAGDPVSDALVEICQPDIGGFGRCATDAEGAYGFETARTPFAYVMVFARGLLRHLVTRVEIDAGAVTSFDIHLQGPDETVFFDV